MLDELPNCLKLNPRAKKMVFTGFVDGSKSIHYYDTSTCQIRVSQNVSFSKNRAPLILNYLIVIPGSWSERESMANPDMEPAQEPVETTSPKITTHSQASPDVPVDSQSAEVHDEGRPCQNISQINYKLAANPQMSKPVPRFAPSKSTSIESAKMTGPIIPSMDLQYTPDPLSSEASYQVIPKNIIFFTGNCVILQAFVAKIINPEIPQLVDEARASPEEREWENAIEKELKNLKKIETWELVKLPLGHTAIGSRMVFALKKNTQRYIKEYKACLVAQEFGQKSGVDYSKEGMFAPIMQFETLCTGITLAAVHRWKMHQLHIKRAYLYAYLDKEIYIQQPSGFEDSTGQVCHLKYLLYVCQRDIFTCLVAKQPIMYHGGGGGVVG